MYIYNHTYLCKYTLYIHKHTYMYICKHVVTVHISPITWLSATEMFSFLPGYDGIRSMIWAPSPQKPPANQSCPSCRISGTKKVKTIECVHLF